jgi:hypothetical protein
MTVCNLLLRAYLLTLNPEWRDREITAKGVTSSETARDEAERVLDELIPAARIPASRQVFLKPPDETVASVMARESAQAELVFMGLLEPEPGEKLGYGERLMQRVESFPRVVMVRNAGRFVGTLV